MFEDYFAQNIKEDEELIEVIHHHWFGLALTALKVAILVIVPLLFAKFLFATAWAAIAFLAYLLVVALYGGYKWVVWYFDVFIITDSRIIDIEQKGLFSREVKEASMTRIQDVTYSVSGFFATLMNYGSVSVRTASDGELKLTKVAEPEEVQNVIIELLALAQKGSKMSAEELVRYISKLRDGKDDQPEDEDENEESTQTPKKKSTK